MITTINRPELSPWPYGGCDTGYDSLAAGDLGSLQYVSGGRIARPLNQSRYCGHVYAGNILGTDQIRRDFIDRVCFTIVPYESTRCERQSPGPAQTVVISTKGKRIDGSSYERNDHELWNIAATHLRAASDRRTLAMSRRGPWHFQQGKWRVRLAGIDGVDTADCVASWQSIRKGWFADRLNQHIDRLHFLAEDRNGNTLRLRYESRRDGNGYEYQLRISQPIDVGTQYRSIPKYLSRWIDSRCF